MPAPRTRLSVLPLEDRITPYVFGADDRVASRLDSVVRLVSDFPDGTTSQGSGVFVNNYHILTAGHVVWDKDHGGMATRVVVQQPGYDRDTGQLVATWTGYSNIQRVGKGWADNRNFNEDWGLVRLTKDSVANGLSGAQVMAVATDAVLTANASAFVTAGYPADLQSGKAQYRAPAAVAGRTALTLSSYGDTKPGQSGGPLYLDHDFFQNVYGVVSNEAIPAGSRPNGFTRLTAPLLSLLNEYMAADNAAYAALPPTQNRLTVIPVGPSGSGGFRGVVSSTSTTPPPDSVPPIPMPTTPPPDTTPPGVTVSRAAGQPAAVLLPVGSINLVATFDEPVTGLGASGVRLDGAAAAGATVAVGNPSGDGRTYTLTVTGVTATGRLGVSVAAGAATDLAGNPSTEATGGDGFVIVDARPVVLPYDLAETNAADWAATAALGLGSQVTLAVDSEYKESGEASLVVTATSITLGGLSVQYNVPGGVADVHSFRAFVFGASVDLLSGGRPLSGAFQVAVTDAGGHRTTYSTRAEGAAALLTLDAAVGGWHRFEVPLVPAASDLWARTSDDPYFPADLTRVRSVQFGLTHSSSDLRLWLDDVGFRGYPPAGDESPVTPVNAPPDPYGPRPNASQNEAFVKGLYRTVLGRDADAGGVADWTAAMANGAQPLDVTRGFWNAPEHRASQVDGYYRYFLGREPDLAGRLGWMDALTSGAIDELAAAQLFLQSPECIARGGTTGGYVDLLYTSVLGRPADAAGRADWVAKLDSGAVTRPQLVAGIVRSAESYNRVLSSFYRAYLKRSPSAAALADWRAVLNRGGVALGDVAVGFIGSAEFYANAAGAVG